ncbi:hypothetical protein PG993_001245 [Apiospora rasikravindrae]|uniref:Uncharacterized protein n=1 Tax=Apiospora rasikravindrae TaxID=990691 RepID=A0ABR1UAT8_9PEZI
MSSNSGLSRTRSLRKPAAINAGSTNQKENTKLAPSSSNDPAKGSPSRLPQVKPLTRAATTTATTSTSSRARATNPTRTSTTSAAPPPSTTGSTRALSGVLGNRNGLATTRRASPTTAENAAAAAKPLGRTPSTRPAPPSAPSASANIRSASRESTTSTQRPSSSGGASSTSTLTRSKTLGHARAKSTATGLTAATTLKPPSSRVSTAASSTVSAKPTTRSQTLQARGATHRASASTSSATTAAAAAPASLPAASQNRPAFNTNQQHYSPLKSHAPKPLTSTFLAPPSPSKLPANVAITAETARLQTELLQLSLLHRDAGATAAEWHESAQQKLSARFGELVRAEQALGGRERDGVEARNAAVLVRWGAARASTEVVGGLEEKVQMLDQVVNGVWRFGEPGGRYARVIEEFEDWAGRLQGIMEARRKGDLNSLLGNGLDDTDEVLFIGDLENRWRDECPGLVRKLEEWRRMLRHLGPVPDSSGDAPATTTTGEEGGGSGQKSSLARILEGCTCMVDDMLAELALMEQMVREAVRAEDDWIEAMNKELNLGKETDSQGDRSAPLWKMAV